MPDASTGRTYSSGGVYTESSNNEQRNDDSQWSFQGAIIGKEGGVHIIRNSIQANKGGAGGFQGAASLEAASKLQQEANDCYSKNAGDRK